MKQIKIDINECFSTIPCGCSAHIALAAYRNISFTPEKRAEQELNGTQQDIVALFNEMATYITPETKEAAFEAFADYVRKYKSKYNAYLHAKSNCVSWMITGRSGLNVRQAEKANDRERKLYECFSAWREKAFNSMLKHVFGVYATSGVIMADNPDAIALLRIELERMQEEQALMKHINKAFRCFDKSKSIKEFFESTGIDSEDRKSDIASTLRMGYGIPYPSFSLTNLNNRIKNKADRIERLERYQAQAKTEEIQVGSVTFKRNKELVRLQLFFPGKPDSETIKNLKSRGFRWSPSQGAWQRQDTNAAMYAAKNIINAYNDRLNGGAK